MSWLDLFCLLSPFVAHLLSLVCCCCVCACWRRLRILIVRRRWMTIVRRYLSCACLLFAVAWALSLPVRLLARIVIFHSVLLSKDVRWSSLILVVWSCGHAYVVGGALSSSVHLLATIAARRCFSSLGDDRSSLLGSRLSSSFIHLFARIATVHCVSLSEDDRSVSRVVRHRLFVVRGRLGVVSRRPLSLVCRRSCVIACHSSYVIARPSLVCRR